MVASGSCGGGVPQLSPAMVRQRPQLVGGVVGLALCASLACCAAGDGGLATTSRQRRRQQADGDLEVVHARLLAALLWSNDPAEINQCNVSGAHDYAQTLLPNGAWPDVNYTDRTRTGAWQPERHLRRQLAMAIAARQAYESLNQTDAALVAAVHRAISF